MIWILCSLDKPYDLEHFKTSANALGIELRVIDPTKLQIVQNGVDTDLYYECTLVVKPKWILNWNGCMNGQLEYQIEASLRKLGTIICNSLEEIEHFQDKFRFQIETDMPVAKSLKVHSSNLQTSISLIEEHFNYPFILKCDTGSLGLGVYKIENNQNLIQIIEIITLLDTNFKVHIEEFINYKHDLRMYIIGDDYHVMERIATNDFRANYSRQGAVQSYPKTELTDIVYSQVRSKYNAIVLGVDILLTASDYYICEINSSPGFTGLEEVYNINIASEILGWIIK